MEDKFLQTNDEKVLNFLKSLGVDVDTTSYVNIRFEPDCPVVLTMRKQMDSKDSGLFNFLYSDLETYKLVLAK